MTLRYFFKHAVLGLMALTMVSAVLSGCGGDDDHTNGASPPTASLPGPPDPRGVLLSLGIFGAYSGVTIPFTGVLSQDATNQYSLSFAANGFNVHVALVNFVLTEGTPLAENSSTPVTITFPPRNVGLITSIAQTDYLNFSVTASSFTGDGNVDMDNGVISADRPLESDMIVSLDSGESYLFTTINGVFVQPYQVLVSGKCGLYLGLPNVSILVDVLVWGGAAFSVGY